MLLIKSLVSIAHQNDAEAHQSDAESKKYMAETKCYVQKQVYYKWKAKCNCC